MKKILILTLILSTIFLTSCGNNDVLGNKGIMIGDEPTTLEDMKIFDN